MSATAELVLDRLTKRFGETVAVDNVTLRVPPGTYVVLLGPSGSGKTTVLSMLGGFTLPSDGRVLIGGQDVSMLPPARRPTATVFQDYALFPHLDVAGNVGFGLSVRGLPRSEIAGRVGRALAQVGLPGYGRRAIAATSGGQRQRIALARALVTEPALLLLDEPLGALDLSLRRQMQDELRRIQRAQGRTFVHVTHDQEEAMAIADLIVIMNRGRVEDAGEPARLYAQPRTRFAATFMGESTLIEGIVASGGEGRVAVDTPCGRLVVEGDRPLGAAVTVAVRPEAIRVGPAEPGDQALGSLRVEEVVFQGSYARVTGTAAGGRRLLARVDPGRPPGGEVSIAVRAGGAVLLED